MHNPNPDPKHKTLSIEHKRGSVMSRACMVAISTMRLVLMM